MTAPATETRIGDTRVVGVVENGRVIEIWHLRCDNVTEKQVDIDLPKESRSRTVDGQRQQCDVSRHQIARQPWGHFTVKMYQVKRAKPWLLIFGLATLVPGMLIAVSSCIRQFASLPVTTLMVAFGLIVVGALSIMASGWQANTKVTDTVPLESLGVSTQAAGFTGEVTAAVAIPACYKAGHFKGEMEFEAAVGKAEVLEEHSMGSGWYRISKEGDPLVAVN